MYDHGRIKASTGTKVIFAIASVFITGGLIYMEHTGDLTVGALMLLAGITGTVIAYARSSAGWS